MLPDDLKDYKAPGLFDFVNEEPLMFLIVCLLVALLLDLVQR